MKLVFILPLAALLSCFANASKYLDFSSSNFSGLQKSKTFSETSNIKSVENTNEDVSLGNAEQFSIGEIENLAGLYQQEYEEPGEREGESPNDGFSKFKQNSALEEAKENRIIASSRTKNITVEFPNVNYENHLHRLHKRGNDLTYEKANLQLARDMFEEIQTQLMDLDRMFGLFSLEQLDVLLSKQEERFYIRQKEMEKTFKIGTKERFLAERKANKVLEKITALRNRIKKEKERVQRPNIKKQLSKNVCILRSILSDLKRLQRDFSNYPPSKIREEIKKYVAEVENISRFYNKIHAVFAIEHHEKSQLVEKINAEFWKLDAMLNNKKTEDTTTDPVFSKCLSELKDLEEGLQKYLTEDGKLNIELFKRKFKDEWNRFLKIKQEFSTVSSRDFCDCFNYAADKVRGKLETVGNVARLQISRANKARLEDDSDEEEEDSEESNESDSESD